jgi:hypothetical protein
VPRILLTIRCRDSGLYDYFRENPPPNFRWRFGMPRNNSDLGFLQTIEAGSQECHDITGDWVPHLFINYATNGYSDDGDNKGGYNTDVDGWVQYDNVIYPGTTFTPYSTRGRRSVQDEHRVSALSEQLVVRVSGPLDGLLPRQSVHG